MNKISPTATDGGPTSDYEYHHDSTFSVSMPTPISVPLTPKALRALINSTNARSKILNLDELGSLSPGDPVIVIQVHDRVDYLRALINSLEDVQGIEKALLVFTHDVYDAFINSIVLNIKFCKVSEQPLIKPIPF